MNLKQMEKESDCIETIFQSYITLKSTRTVFLFFEGKDDFKYYWCRLAPFIGEQGYEHIYAEVKEMFCNYII